MTHCTLKKSRSWLSGRYSIEFELRLPLSASKLPLIVDGILREVIPEALKHHSTLQDLKGLDLPNPNSAPKEELLLIKGELPLRKKGDDRNAFQIQVLTNFKEFIGTHHVEHSVTEERLGILPDFVLTRNIGRVFPLTLTEFRFGVELFSSQQFVIFGFTPEVTQKLMLSLKQNELRLEITAEKLRTVTELPFAATGIFTKLSDSLDKALSLNITKEYLDRLGSGPGATQLAN